MAMAMFGMCVVVAPIIGPTLGGWITDSYSWRWVFFINIPIGILAVFLAMMLVQDPPYFIRKKIGANFRIDYIGLGLISLGLGALADCPRQRRTRGLVRFPFYYHVFA